MHFGDLLKEVIKEHGSGVLEKEYLYSILTDKGLNTDRDISYAERAIIKELCKEGVFKEVHNNCTKEKWELTFRRLSHHIISDNGRQEEIVNQLFQEIAVALGFNAHSAEWDSAHITKSNVKVDVAAGATGKAANALIKEAEARKKSTPADNKRSIFGSMVAAAARSFARSLSANGAISINGTEKTTSKNSPVVPSVKKAKAEERKTLATEKGITIPYDFVFAGRRRKGIYTGQTKGNRPNGDGEIVLRKGMSIQVRCLNGIITDVRNYKYSTGVIYSGEIKNGRRWGKGQMVWPDGASYNGSWVKDNISGKGTMIWANGVKFTGLWAANKTRKGIMTKANGEIILGQKSAPYF